MEIKIKVEIGLAPAMERALMSFARGISLTAGAEAAAAGASLPAARTGEHKTGAAAAEAAETAGTSLPEARTGEHRTEARTGEHRTEAPAEAPEAEAPEAEAPAETPVEAPADEVPAEVVPPTDEEMRTLMDIAISRVAGNGWMDSKDPAVVRLRRGCTEQFKAIARHLGAEKPTALQGDARTRFVAELDNIYVKNGADVEWVPF